MKFNLHNQSDFARRAELDFPRGKIQTPAFMPVGTNATVKGLTVEDLKINWIRDYFRQYLSSNAYVPVMRLFEIWAVCINFQIGIDLFLQTQEDFKYGVLGDLVKISEEGVKFSSPYDGKKIFMTPEDSITNSRKSWVRYCYGI